MRFNFIVLFTSCALLASVSDASNVRGNPITSHDKSANVQSVAESPQGTPVKSLQRADKTSNDEERGLTKVADFFRSKFEHGLATKVVNFFRSKLNHAKSEDELLQPFLFKKDGTRRTALEVLQRRGLYTLRRQLEKRKYTPLMATLSKELGDKNVAMALKEYGKLKNPWELMYEQFKYSWLQPGEKQLSHDHAFKILMQTNDPKNPISMFDGEIEILENFIEWLARHKRETYPPLSSDLFSTLERGAGGEVVLSMISSHHANRQAKLLEKKLYKFLSRAVVKDGKVKVENRVIVRRDAVKGLFAYGKMEDMGVELLDSQVLTMLARFYIKSSKSQAMPDVTTKVKALREGFGDDKKVEDLLSNAMKNEAIANVAKEFMEEYQVQKHTLP